ncbi:MAG: S24 family peptidase [Lautropia sp.]
MIPIVASPDPAPASADASFDACAGAESFALMVLGDSMRPEFDDGDVVIIEPGGLAADGAFVLARCGDGWGLRLLTREGEGWTLSMLDGAEPPVAIADLSSVRGVVIQKSKPGRRRSIRRYVD